MNGRRLVLLSFAVSSLVFVGGAQSGCAKATLDCTSTALNVFVPLGQCVAFENPCVDHMWVNGDRFVFEKPVAGISIDSHSNERSICADTNAEIMVNRQVPFTYSRANDFGEGTLNLSTAVSLTVAASASRSAIEAGGSSQLDAAVSGGTPPYVYSWAPVGSLSARNIQNPLATPVVTTRYTVTVSDSVGQSASSSVTVSVGFSVAITASPSTIGAGESSQLFAAVAGGTPPYAFSWSPAASLSATNIYNPLATPPATTTYDLVVTDSAGLQAVGAVTVVVTAAVPPVARLTVTRGGHSSEMSVEVIADASASTGNIVSYQWNRNWNGNPAAPFDATTTTPVYTFYTAHRATVRLRVTDANGLTADATASVGF